jgi:succinate dehydrogenase / fumarate reductase membrane anchor subunit
MAIYSLILLAVFFFNVPINYGAWRAVFEHGWMRVATLLFAFSLAWHAWVGMRDILMDYVKPTAARLSLEVGVLLVLALYLGWTVQVLWR